MQNILVLTISIFLTTQATAASDPTVTNLKAAIKKFSQTSKVSEKYVEALVINTIAALNEEKLSTFDLTPAELLEIDEAKQNVNSINKLAQQLESQLTQADIQAITKSNPKSIWPEIGRFQFSVRKDDCTPAKYDEVKSKVDIAELYNRVPQIWQYHMASEGSFDNKYRKTLSGLIKTDPRFKNFEPLLETVLSEKTSDDYNKRSGLKSMIKDFRASQAGRLKKSEEELVKYGVATNEVRVYVVRMLRLSPECIGTLSSYFHKSIRKDFAVARVNKFAEKIKNAEITHDDLASGVQKFVDAKDPYLESSYDPRGGSLSIVKVSDNSVRIASTKFYGKQSAADEIYSTPIPVTIKAKPNN